jgi:hypothetical protein
MGTINPADPEEPLQEGFIAMIQAIGILFVGVGFIGGFLPKKQFIMSIITFFVIFSIGELIFFSSLFFQYPVVTIFILIIILNFTFLMCLIPGLFFSIPLKFYLKPFIHFGEKRGSEDTSGIEPIQTISYSPKAVGLSTETSFHNKEGLRGTVYTIENFNILEPQIDLVVRDHREKVIFNLKKMSRIKNNYKIYNAQNIELGDLIGGLMSNSMTIREKETGLESILKLHIRPSSLDLSVTTPSDKYFSSKRMISDQAFSINLSDSQARQVFSFERPRHFRKISGKRHIRGTIRDFGNLNPLLACVIGVLLYLNPIFTMKNSDVELLDKSTEVKIERKWSFKGSVFVYRDKNGNEIFRGKRSGVFKSRFVFTNPSGKLIGELSSKRQSEWVITDSQQGISGTLNLKISRKDRLTHLSGDSSPFTLVVGNETFSFGNFEGFKREIYDRNGNLSYAIFGYNKQFTLDIKQSLTPNFWCFLSVCLIHEFFIPKDDGVG